MTRQHAARSTVVRRLRLSPDRIAAAAALQDPNLLLQLKAAESHAERPITAAPTRPSRIHPGSADGETGGALLRPTWARRSMEAR